MFLLKYAISCSLGYKYLQHEYQNPKPNLLFNITPNSFLSLQILMPSLSILIGKILFFIDVVVVFANEIKFVSICL